MTEPPSHAVRVLGVDPGLNITGYGVVDFTGREPAVVEAGTLRTHAKAPMAERIAQIHADLSALLTELQPDRVAIEKLYAHYKHPRTSILMGHARGVILLAAAQAGVPVIDLPATKVKKSLTGNGHASKTQMQRAIQSLCRLDQLPEPPDVADALAIALCAGKSVT
jgi:crossover junction endodeoxyribonuclease RuvC